MITLGLSEHEARSADELAAMVEVAKSRRSTAATEKNDTSSRSHGIAIITVGQPGSATAAADGDMCAPAEGRLYHLRSILLHLI